MNVYANLLYVQVSFLNEYTWVRIDYVCACFSTLVATFAGPFSYLPQLRMLDVKWCDF